MRAVGDIVRGRVPRRACRGAVGTRRARTGVPGVPDRTDVARVSAGTSPPRALAAEGSSGAGMPPPIMGGGRRRCASSRRRSPVRCRNPKTSRPWAGTNPDGGGVGRWGGERSRAFGNVDESGGPRLRPSGWSRARPVPDAFRTRRAWWCRSSRPSPVPHGTWRATALPAVLRTAHMGATPKTWRVHGLAADATTAFPAVGDMRRRLPPGRLKWLEGDRTGRHGVQYALAAMNHWFSGVSQGTP